VFRFKKEYGTFCALKRVFFISSFLAGSSSFGGAGFFYSASALFLIQFFCLGLYNGYWSALFLSASDFNLTAEFPGLE
jgi:hypothetical protein